MSACSRPGTTASTWSDATPSAMFGSATSSNSAQLMAHVPPGTRTLRRSRQRRRPARPDPVDSRRARSSSGRIGPAQRRVPRRSHPPNPRAGHPPCRAAPKIVHHLPSQTSSRPAPAPISAICWRWPSRFIGPDTVCLFLKGKGVAAELTDAAKDWNMLAETAAERRRQIRLYLEAGGGFPCRASLTPRRCRRPICIARGSPDRG